jgi:hypothetical protein
MAVDDDMGNKFDSVLDRYMRADDAKWTDPHAVPKDGGGIDQSGPVNRYPHGSRQSEVRHRIHGYIFPS